MSEELRVIRMTVGPQFVAELEQVKSYLSHRVPSGSLETLIRECFRITLEVCARRRRGAEKGKRRAKAEASKPAAEGDQDEPVRPHDSSARVARTPERSPRTTGRATDRYIPVAVRREVWERDEGRCAFVGTNGKRCGSRDRLEFHHQRPFAVGGKATVANCSLRCHIHNQYEARLDFGDEHMDRFTRCRPWRARAPDSLEFRLLPGS